MKIAIMQPYFAPYAGYFRLLCAADVLVLLDCVQFPRRGWVHRNQFKDQQGNVSWVTLPLKKASRDATRICDLEFLSDASELFQDRSKSIPSLTGLSLKYPSLHEAIQNFGVRPVDYLANSIELVRDSLDLPVEILRSSDLNIEKKWRGQDRILAIAQHFGAKTYINSPNGKSLYDQHAFEEKNIELKFLIPYGGDFGSIVDRIYYEPVEELVEEIRINTSFS